MVEYYPHPLSNVKLELTKYPDAPRFHPMLDELVAKLTLKYPKWDFIGRADECMGGDDPYYRAVSLFTQANPPQAVGTIRIEARYTNHGREDCYALRSPRVAKHRERGDTVMTTKLASAIKTVNKLFTSAPMSEMISDAVQDGWNRLHRAVNTATYETNQLANDTNPLIHKFVSEHPAEFMAWLPDETSRKLVHELAEAKDRKNKLMEFQNNWSKTLTVLTVDDKYVVRPTDGEEVTVYSAEDVSEHIRKCLGMLKLVDVGDVLPNVGVRAGSKHFVIVGC
jgi:hypothetical protein